VPASGISGSNPERCRRVTADPPGTRPNTCRPERPGDLVCLSGQVIRRPAQGCRQGRVWHITCLRCGVSLCHGMADHRAVGASGPALLRASDVTVLAQISAVTNSRATYGYRRVWAMVNRSFRTGYNRKRIRRVMQLHGLMLAPRSIAGTAARICARCSSRRRINAGAPTCSSSRVGVARSCPWPLRSTVTIAR
jgi:hypothetical protein